MRKKEIIQKVLQEYKDAIKYGKKSKCNADRFLVYLCSKKLQFGLCYKFNKNQRYISYIKKYISCNEDYICLTPFTGYFKKEMYYRLQKRIEVLEKELKRCK